jgi:hypothetical protein
MTLPTTRVYIAFNAGWVGTPTWTEVTNRVRVDPGISTGMGLSEELSESQPNRLSLVLRNDDGRFTPGNTASIYYPNVKRGRQIKVESTGPGGVVSTRFTGYIDDWAPNWVAKVGGINDCAITATSRMARIGRGTELRSIVEEQILVNEPIAYYTLGEPEGSTSASDSSGAGADQLAMRGSGSAVVFGTATGPGTDGLTAATFANGKFLESASIGGVSGLTTWTVAFAFSALTASDDYLALSLGASDAVTWTIAGTTTGRLLVTESLGPQLTTAVAVNDGLVHSVVVTSTPGGSVLYVDGVSVDSDVSLGSLQSTFRLGWDLSGSLSHFAIIPSALTAGEAADIDEAMTTGFTGETVEDRLTRYASYASIADTDIVSDVGQVADLAHIDTTGKTVLQVMREVESTEAGILFDGRDGDLNFHDRAHRYSATSAFTLSYTAGQIANELLPVLDDQRQKNSVTAASADGVTTATVTDAASVDDDGWYSESLTVATTDPTEPLMRAGWLVNTYAEPTVRVSAVDVLLNKLPDALVTALLAATVGTRFTLTGLPANAPASTMSLFVEGVEETITADEHRLTFHTSPAEVYDVLELDDTALGVLDDDKLAL